MRNTILFLLGLFIVSCSGVRFENPQPAGVKSIEYFPSQIVGLYLNIKEKDTLIITKKEMKYSDTTISIDSEHIILKKYRGHYVLSYRVSAFTDNTNYEMTPKNDSTYAKSWDISPFQLINDTLVFHNIKSDKNEITNDINNIVSKKRIHSIGNNRNDLLINPTRKEFRQMLKKNIFNEEDSFVRLN